MNEPVTEELRRFDSVSISGAFRAGSELYTIWAIANHREPAELLSEIADERVLSDGALDRLAAIALEGA